MSRIERDKINWGSSFVISSDGKQHLNKEITDAKVIAAGIIAKAKEEAAEITAKAKEHADKVFGTAQAKADSIIEEVVSEARRKGYEEGYQDGQEKISSELEELVLNVDNFIKCEFEIKNRIIKSLHSDILDLVLEIAKKVCKDELQTNDRVLIKVVAEAISHLKEKESVTVIVNPDMAQKIYAISDKLKELIPNLEYLKIVEDTSVSPDGTVVESVGSRIDARVSTQIELISQKLKAELDATPTEQLVVELKDIENSYDKSNEI